MPTTFDTPIGTSGKINNNTGQVMSGAMAGLPAVDSTTLGNFQKANPGLIANAQDYAKMSGTPITASSLTPTTPYNLQTPPATPTTDGLAMTNSGVTSSIATDATTPPATPANPQKDSLQQMLQSISGDISGQSAAVDQIKSDTQLYEKQQKATAVSNQLDQMDKAYRDEVNNLKKNAGGVYGGAVDQQIATATDRYENNRANVALTYKVLSGDATAAQTIVNDKVTSLQNQNTQKLNLYQLAVNAVNNDLTESEKLKVQANLTQMANDHKTITDAYTTALTNASQNGAPASVLSAIDTASRVPGATAASVMAAAGSYNVDKLKQLQIQKAGLDVQKTSMEIAQLNDPSLTDPIVTDPQSSSILAQTGLSMPAFAYLTQGTSALTRMTAAQRKQYMSEAASWANKNNIDISTFGAQYGALSKTVGANLLRNNQAKVAESELAATVTNLSTAATEAGLSNLKGLNVAKIWAGQQLNTPAQATYKFHLEQLRNEFALYNAALSGQIDVNGNVRQITEADMKKADEIIQNGFAAGSLDGFSKGLNASMSKMGTVLQSSINAQNKQVWNLFGVGDKYDATAGTTSGGATGSKTPPVVPISNEYSDWLKANLPTL